MANQANFPTSLDTQILTASSGDTVPVSSWNILMDGVFQLESKVGVDTSTVATSLDYLLTSAGSYNPGHRHTSLSCSGAATAVAVQASADRLYLTNYQDVKFNTCSYQFPGDALCGTPFYCLWTQVSSSGLLFTYEWDCYRHKTVDETLANSNTLQTDDELSFVVSANSSYSFKVGILVNGGATSDFKVSFSGVSANNIRWASEKQIYNSPGDGTYEALTCADSKSFGLAGTGTDAFIALRGVMETGVTSGTVYLTWAQNTASATTLTVKKGSWIWVEKNY